MNKILLPCEYVEVEGQKYEINTDFSVWIRIEELFLKKSNNFLSVFAEILALAYPVLPPNPVIAVERLLWFYSCGEGKKSGEQRRSFSAPSINLFRDFGYIWAAFLGEYGIDLSKEALHWWRFQALLYALGDDCRFSKIVSYRNMDTSKLKDAKARQFYETMKNKYRLPDVRSQQEREMDTVLKLEGLF